MSPGLHRVITPALLDRGCDPPHPGPRGARALARLVAAALALSIVLAGGAHAFVILDSYFVYGDDGELDIRATLEAAPRWSAAEHASTGGAGLHDGIRVGITPGFAEALTLRVTGATDPVDVRDLQKATAAAFYAWETPELFFDVEIDAATQRGSMRGMEIDVFAVPDSDPVFADNDFFGVTYLSTEFVSERVLTSGVVLPGYAIEGADIFINIDRVASIAGLLPRNLQLAALQRLVMHELGHALGLDHPNIFVDENLDTDGNPFNPMTLDPNDPIAGLTLSASVDVDAILSNMPSLNALVYTQLQNDDRGGRDALYPSLTGTVCTGDCDRDGSVSVDELVTAVSIVLGERRTAECARIDRVRDGLATIDELVAAVNTAARGCRPG